jgi:dTMP kinase
VISTKHESGRFITLEGTDGAGKSTQLKTVSDFLQQADIPHIISREPGGTRLGELIRNLLLGEADLAVQPMAQLMLVFAARAQHIEEVIQPALSTGTWVVCDRFTDASYAYQGEAGGLGFRRVAQMENFVQSDLRPDLTLLLDVPVEIGQNRTAARDSTSDRFEALELSEKHRIRKAYLKLATMYPNRIQVIDASQSEALVNQAMLMAIRAFVSCQ